MPDKNEADRWFCDNIHAILPYTLTGGEGIESPYATFNAIRYIVRNRIPGDVVECGVWRGGSMMLIAMYLQHIRRSYPLWLYDTCQVCTTEDLATNPQFAQDDAIALASGQVGADRNKALSRTGPF